MADGGKGGRPSTYSQDVADEVCRRVEDGENILDICASDGMPAWSTLCSWRRRIPGFSAMYARAREASAEALEMEALQIAAGATDKDSAAAARVQVDAIKWAAAKRNPKTYGDKIDLNHTGEITISDPEERRRRILELTAKLTPLIEGVAEEVAPEEGDDDC